MKTIRVVAAVIEKQGRYLITRRRANAVLPLLWEFPGGKAEEDETDSEALQRELLLRLGVRVEVMSRISSISHSYALYQVELTLYECKLSLAEESKLAPLAVDAFEWVYSADFEHYTFTPADELSVSRMLE